MQLCTCVTDDKTDKPDTFILAMCCLHKLVTREHYCNNINSDYSIYVIGLIAL